MKEELMKQSVEPQLIKVNIGLFGSEMIIEEERGIRREFGSERTDTLIGWY